MSSAPVDHSVEPAYFGPRERQLLGCYHVPREPVRERTVLLCYPSGHEYIRCQRPFRRLADQLARAGFPTFRFDYLGTGDSVGESDDVGLEDWVEDVALASEYVRSRSSSRTLDLVGMRLGATLGMLSDADVGFDRMVLWQPVLDGARFVEELRQAQRAFLQSQGMPRELPEDGGTIEVMGNRFRSELIRELESLDLRDAPIRDKCKVLLIDNGAADGTFESVAARLRSRGASVRYERVPEPAIWLAEPYKMLLPHESLRTITAALTEGWT